MIRDLETKTPPHFTLQEVVQRSGLSEHTLRYYERIGLLDHVKRDSSSGHRRYTAEDVQKIETLACLRTTGMSIEDMRMYFALLKDGLAAADQQLALFEAQKEALEQELDRPCRPRARRRTGFRDGAAAVAIRHRQGRSPALVRAAVGLSGACPIRSP